MMLKQWVDDDDERDDDKVLKHGERQHIPMMAMDAARAAADVSFQSSSVGPVSINARNVVHVSPHPDSGGTLVKLSDGSALVVNSPPAEVASKLGIDAASKDAASKDAAMVEFHRLSRPGPRFATDAARSASQRAYDAAVLRDSLAWRSPSEVAQQSESNAELGRVLAVGDSVKDEVARVQTIRDAAYSAAVERDRNAWKNP